MEAVQRIHKRMMLDELEHAQLVDEWDATTVCEGEDVMDLAADLERMMVDSCQKGGQEEAGIVPSDSLFTANTVLEFVRTARTPDANVARVPQAWCWTTMRTCPRPVRRPTAMRLGAGRARRRHRATPGTSHAHLLQKHRQHPR